MLFEWCCSTPKTKNRDLLLDDSTIIDQYLHIKKNLHYYESKTIAEFYNTLRGKFNKDDEI